MRTAAVPRKGLASFGGFSKQAKIMITATFLEGVAHSFIWFLFALYLEEWMYTPGSIGIILMVMGLTSTVPLLPAGYLGDRFGRKRMILIGISLKAMGFVTILVADLFWMFGLAAVFWGLGLAFYMPAFLALMSEKVEEDRRKYLFSLQAFARMMSGAGAILLVGFLPEVLSDALATTVRDGFRQTYWLGVACALAQMVIILPLTEERKEGPAGRRGLLPLSSGPGGEGRGGGRTGTAGALPTIPWKVIVLLCTPMVLLGLGAGLIVPFFQLYFRWRFDTPVAIIGILFSITQLFWGLAYLVMPYFADRVGSVRAITIVQWVAILALLGIPISPSFHFVAIMYLIRMVVMNSTWPILQSYSLGRVPEQHRSFTLSATNFSFNVPKGLTPGIAGFIYEMNLELPFFICAAFYIVATITFFLAFRKHDDRNDT